MEIIDNGAAIDFLRHIGYYHFSGFCLAFESSRHAFLPNVTFEHIKTAYKCDCVLRDLFTEALEIIELDFRAAVAHKFGEKYGAFGHTNPDNFTHRFNHHKWMIKLHKEAERSSEIFVEHFRNRYSEFPDVPIWVTNEIISFGTLSVMCHNMHKIDQKAISFQYRLQPADWASWAHHLSYVRNLCAHHIRLWDHTWDIKPLMPRAQIWNPPYLPTKSRVFPTLLILNHLMTYCPAIKSYISEWRSRVETVLEKLLSIPNVNKEKMGLMKNWKKHPLWK